MSYINDENAYYVKGVSTVSSSFAIGCSISIGPCAMLMWRHMHAYLILHPSEVGKCPSNLPVPSLN